MVKLFGYEIKKPLAERMLGADHVRNGRVKENKGVVSTGYSGEVSRVEHPSNMGNYEGWLHDAEANMAINVLTDIIAGVGFHTEMPLEDNEKEPKTKDPKLKRVDEYAESVNLDEDLQCIANQMLAKGFSAAEKVKGSDGQVDLKILPSENFYMYRDKKGTVLKYTQENTPGSIIAEWKGKEMDDIMMFFNGQTPLRPYGMSLLEPIGALIDGRNDLNTDIIKGVHRWANPIPIMEFSKSKDMSAEAKKSVEDRDADEWVFFYNVNKDDIRSTILTVDPAVRFIPYVELIYYQICEGLHAPLLLYLKNATEASATVMMESVDRLVNGIQRYIKRRVEHDLFEPLVGTPTPRLIWGKPQTGLEKVTMTELASLINSPALANNQKQKLLETYGIDLPPADWESGPPKPEITPFGANPNMPGQGKPNPFQKKADAPTPEFLVEKLNDLNTGLSIIAANFDAGKLKVTEAISMAERTIKASMQRTYPQDYEKHVEAEFQKFIAEKIMKHGAKTMPVYRVQVDN